MQTLSARVFAGAGLGRIGEAEGSISMEETNSIWTTKEIVGAILATGIVSAIANWGTGLVKGWYGQRQAFRYGAMRSAVALERYAVECWHMLIMGDGEFERHREISSRHLPAIPDLPGDIDWKSLDGALADDILSFSNITRVSESLANYAEAWEQNPYDYHSAAKERGLAALKLAGRIRKVSGMKSHDGFDRLWEAFTK